MYRELAQLMIEQAQENKKDKYIEITEGMLAVSFLDLPYPERVEYLEALRTILSVMDFQIYEHYRALADRYVEVLKELLAEGKGGAGSCKPDSVTAQDLLTDYISFGEEKGFLCREWFVREEKKSLDLTGRGEQPLRLLFVSPRSVSFEIVDGGKYETELAFDVYVNGRRVETENKVVRSVFHLLPDREYVLNVLSTDGTRGGVLAFRTLPESVTLNVRDFGACGDGITDDTHCIQTAIMNCPKKGRVLIPAGQYRIKTIFLKSNMQLELAKGAELLAIPDREGLGKMPGVLPSTDGECEYHFGTWEGNPLPMFAGILSGIDVENVQIYGEGILNGNASKETWWNNPKVMKGAYRPRLFFLRDSRRVSLQGITLKNSPSWTMHPFFSEELGFYDLTVRNPFDSPNTDGLDPESCKGVEIAGVDFSLGDDCIAVKSGKIYMGKTYKTPSENIRIHHCRMQNGHGAVTIGSEMAGGVRDFSVENCVFSHTDRGLRIKTRRGRGKDAVLDQIAFRNISMDHVMTPFVVNSFYFCDPDGKTEYVQSRECKCVDERTPSVKSLRFENIEATNCHVAAAYIEGLPERKIEEVFFRNVRISYAEEPKSDVPAMSDGVVKCSKKGLVLKNVRKVTLDRVFIDGCEGDPILLDGIDELVENGKCN